MRARSKFGLGDQDGAKADFALLLKLAPNHALSGQVSPRVVALFEETAREAVTTLTVSVTPATATVQVDGVADCGPRDHPGRDRRPRHDCDAVGISPATQNVTAVAGTPSEVTLDARAGVVGDPRRHDAVGRRGEDRRRGRRQDRCRRTGGRQRRARRRIGAVCRRRRCRPATRTVDLEPRLLRSGRRRRSRSTGRTTTPSAR